MSEEINQFKMELKAVNDRATAMRSEGWLIAYSFGKSGEVRAELTRTVEEHHDL